MGKYRIDKFIINQSCLSGDTCDIRIVGMPEINAADMSMIKDYIEGFMDFDHPIKVNVPYNTYETSLMVARGSGKTRYFQDWLVNQYLWTRPAKVIFHDPATIVFWNDGTKTVVKCQPGDAYSKEIGLALCFSKKMLGNRSNFNNEFKKWIPEE